VPANLPGRVALPALTGLVCLALLDARHLRAIQDAPISPAPISPGAVVRPGGDVRVPAKIKNVAPVYPPAALADRLEGIVIIEATIGVDGRVVNARVLRSIPALNQAALTAVRQREYAPTLLHGVPVAVLMTVTVNFSLGSGVARPGGPTVRSAGQGPVTVVGFIGTSSRLVASTRNGIDVWNVSQKNVLRRQPLAPAYYALYRALSPDGRFLALHFAADSGPGRGEAGGRYETRLVNVETGSIQRLQPDLVGVPGPLAFSGDGRTLLRMSPNHAKTVVAYHAWRLPSLDVVASGTISMDEAGPVVAALTRMGDRFVFASHTRTPSHPFAPMPFGRIHVVEMSSGKLLSTIIAPSIPRALQFSTDAQELFWTHDEDTDVWVSELSTGRGPSRIDGSSASGARGRNPSYGRGGIQGSITALAHASDKARLFALSRTGRSLQIWDSDGRLLVGSLALTADVYALSVSADGRLVALGTDTGVQVFDVTSPAAPVKVFEN
jgi:TonB family protein